jgi:phage tail-like protein
LWTWFNAITMNRIARSTIVISLLDLTGAPQYRWQLNNAFPLKLSGTDLKPDGKQVAVETIEFAYETMTVLIVD